MDWSLMLLLLGQSGGEESDRVLETGQVLQARPPSGRTGQGL